jgi:dTDP-4-dehydrorhamnose reductase
MIPKKIAIFGAGGTLGSTLVELVLAQTDAHIFAFAHSDLPKYPETINTRLTGASLDIGNPGAVQAILVQVKPDLVINAAAMTNVDKCELHRSEALAANALGPRQLAHMCTMLGAYLVHVSTDYIFSGTALQPGPYNEDAPAEPINWYGETKFRGENAIAEIGADRIPWLIVRTALVYGYASGGRSSFIAWLIKELRAGRRVKIVNDQLNTPTFVDDLAVALLQVIRMSMVGTLHLAGPELVRRDLMARQIALHYNLDPSLIDVVTTAELRQIAPRPLYSGLSTKRTGEMNGITMRDLSTGLQALPLKLFMD